MRHDTRRRFEQWALNPGCQANTISAARGIPMIKVAKAEGATPTMGQSPFAITRGREFEALLFADEAQRLRQVLEAKEILPQGSQGFVDCRLESTGGSLHDLGIALKKTELLLRKIAQLRRRRQVASIIAGATLSLPGEFLLPDALLVLDVLVVRYGGKRPELVVGEIKTYPDRGGFTDQTELATARAQAGVYVHALHLAVDRLGLSGELVVSDRGFLVLTKPGTNDPSVRADEDLGYQAQRAAQGFAAFRAAVETIPHRDQSQGIDAVCQAETHYSEACLSFCDRAFRCHQAALQEGSPNALGDDVAQLLGQTNLARALELIEGDPPCSSAEEQLTSLFTTIRELSS